MENKNPDFFAQNQHPLLNLLLEKEKIESSQIQFIQESYQESKTPITNLICKLGLISEKELIQLIAEEEDLEIINLEEMEVSKEMMSLIPQEILQKYQLIPLEKTENQLVLVMSDPNHFQAIQHIISLTKCRIRIVLATPSSITNKLEALFKVKMLENSVEKQFFHEATKNRDLFTKYDLNAPKVLLVAEMLQKFKEQQFDFSAKQLELVKDLNENSLPTLIQALEDENISVRIGAAWFLSELGPKAKPAVTSLIKALNHSDHELRSHAALALSKIGPGIPEAVPALQKALSDKFPKVQRIAAEAIENITGEHIEFKEKFYSLENQPKIALNHSAGSADKNDNEISFTSIFDTNENEQTPFISGTYRGISRKQNSFSLYYLGAFILVMFGFLGIIFTQKESFFSKEVKKPLELVVDLKEESQKNDKNTEKASTKEISKELDKFEENLPWAEENNQLQQEIKQVELEVSQLLKKTREGEFNKNIELLKEAKEKWEQKYSYNKNIQQINKYIEEEEKEKKYFEDRQKEGIKEQKRQQEEKSKVEDFQKFKEEIRKFCNEAEKIELKPQEAKKLLEEAILLKKAMESCNVTKLDTQYGAEKTEILAKLDICLEKLNKQISLLEPKPSVEQDDEMIQKLEKIFLHRKIEKFEKSGNYRISYSFSTNEELEDFESSAYSDPGGEMRTEKKWLVSKGLIRKKRPFSLSEFEIIIKFPAQSFREEVGILFLQKNEQEYIGIFIQPKRKSIALLQYSITQNPDCPPRYLAQSLPLSEYFDENKENSITLKMSPNKIEMLTSKKKKFLEFKLNSEIFVMETIGFYSKNEFKIENLEIYTKKIK